MALKAALTPRSDRDGPLHDDPDQGAMLKRLLGRLNVCSKEYWVRQYDHEVQGGSVVKPLTGARGDGPPPIGRRAASPLQRPERGSIFQQPFRRTPPANTGG